MKREQRGRTEYFLSKNIPVLATFASTSAILFLRRQDSEVTNSTNPKKFSVLEWGFLADPGGSNTLSHLQTLPLSLTCHFVINFDRIRQRDLVTTHAHEPIQPRDLTNTVMWYPGFPHQPPSRAESQVKLFKRPLSSQHWAFTGFSWGVNENANRLTYKPVLPEYTALSDG